MLREQSEAIEEQVNVSTCRGKRKEKHSAVPRVRCRLLHISMSFSGDLITDAMHTHQQLHHCAALARRRCKDSAH